MRAWWPYRQAIALILAVFVTAGMSLSFVQAADMSIEMTIMSDMGDGDCSACPGNADEGFLPCSPVCVVPVLALLPSEPAVVTAAEASQLPSLPSPLLHGRGSPPDPSPPRSSDPA